MRELMTDRDARITDLVGRLTEDSKRLVRDEVHLAKLEVRESAHLAGRGAIFLALGFGVSSVAMVAFTILLATALGRLVGSLWGGALLAAVVEIAIAAWLVVRGLHDLKQPPYTLGESREELRRTAAWITAGRAD